MLNMKMRVDIDHPGERLYDCTEYLPSLAILKDVLRESRADRVHTQGSPGSPNTKRCDLH